ncbi:choline-binding transcriptional repressor BetI [Paracoccus aminophilus]|uniref:HTH-type transcriptional regulator BetI n=1 Tax=Paracoccus aminophilus JCM 7686 TaxID=1367847 RepID=S5XX19_PARAH|nr:transcriptional regulator BetI [Paracoccus aminophilus]AGT07985.1 HTH-type transcriptional regulator [Paracoccus aminophilus JCM 7686]
MPKLGVEPIRKAALINAAITMVGRTGSLDVTVAQIAREAGMSSALAHHYFGSKDKIFLAAMRQILSSYRDGVREALRDVTTPRARLDAIVTVSFATPNFDTNTVAAWLNFYALALVDPAAARLLRVYRNRLRSNLLTALNPLVPERAQDVAETLGALIDGVYLRAALSEKPDASMAERIVQDFLREILA